MHDEAGSVLLDAQSDRKPMNFESGSPES